MPISGHLNLLQLLLQWFDVFGGNMFQQCRFALLGRVAFFHETFVDGRNFRRLGLAIRFGLLGWRILECIQHECLGCRRFFGGLRELDR